MALEMNDLMTMKALSNGHDGMTPYEQVKVGYMQAKKPSGVAIAGLTVASVAAAAGIGAWIFAPLYGNAKASQSREAAQGAKDLAAAQYAAALQLMNQQNQNTNATIDRLLNALNRETDARVNGDTTITQTVTDTLSGSQQGTLTANQAADLSAVNTVMQQTYSDFVTGRASLNPTPVSLYSAPQPCNCPGCGCNG